ncbi:MarR family winged helix-turn-helix transcriptional regulator [Propylenella binzhouense]|uniref:MarR family transcriptional regulator n=1 Tax=Propylenella binzhouense TaxID=2555902 RepID=A0A964T3V7_9HYPH|nr:MarR family transcriptional regulator [Propylenella binzhouense]MYZ47953.1 MarR family transcriptional regulator [Propylenella binzhouense]
MNDRITFELLQAARAYRVRSAKLLSRVGLYPGQDSLLKLLHERGPLTMGEAAAALSIQPPTVTKMVNRLSASGLIRTDGATTDRRKTFIALTEEARAKVDEIERIWNRLEAEALEEVELTRELCDQLATITRNLSRSGPAGTREHEIAHSDAA